MLLVKTKLKQSPIHGLGVFADEFIAKGTKTWEFNPRFDLVLTAAEVAEFPECARAEIAIHAYVSMVDGTYVLCSDNGKFMNHSNDPNTYSVNCCDYATRDILVSEEITCDYRSFDLESSLKLSF